MQATRKAAARPGEAKKALNRKELGPVFEKAVVSIGARLNQLEWKDIEGRYEIGRLILGVQKRWEERGVTRLTNKLHLDRSTVYDFRSVAAKWSPGELRQLLDRAKKVAYGLSWSHLVELQGYVGAPQFEKVVEAAIKEKASVRRLRELLNASPKGSGVNGIDFSRQAASLRSQAEKMLDVAIRLHGLGEPFRDPKVTLDDDMAKELAKAVASNEEVSRQADAANKTLDTILQRHKSKDVFLRDARLQVAEETKG